MKRDKQADRAEQFEKLNTRKRRRPFLLMFLLLGAVVVAILPRLLIHRSIVLAAVERFGGLQPLRIDLEKVSAGWFTPASLSGLKIANGDGVVLAEVGTIDTDKGLLAWLMSSADLGTIHLSEVLVDVEAHAGSTNIERSLQHLIGGQPAVSTTDKSTGAPAAVAWEGRLKVTDAKVRLRNRDSTESWLLAVEAFSLDLPRSGQILGPMQLQANLHALTPGDQTTGTVKAELTEADFGTSKGLALRAAMNAIPLGVWRAIKHRLPEIPVDNLTGNVSGQFASAYLDSSRWSVELPQVVARNLSIDAPQIVGNKPAQLAEISLIGKCSFDSQQLMLEKIQLTCDAASVNAAARLPLPIVPPTVAQPWMANATINASGTVDLPRLVNAAQTLVPMKDGMQLNSGNAQFRWTQELDAANVPRSQLELTLADLSAVAGGQKLVWSEPLKVSATVEPSANGLHHFSSQVVAEFCELSGSGNIQQGKFAGNVNLDRLQQKVAQWIELPLQSMSGSANVNVDWNQVQPDVLKLAGKIATTPLAFTVASGGRLSEPAWQGAVEATARLSGTQFTHIDRGQFVMRAEQEALQLDLLEPLPLVADSGSKGTVKAVNSGSAFKATLRGDLASWQRRAAVFQITFPDTRVSGNAELQAGGRLDARKLELNEASWKFEPFEISTTSITLAEPQLVGTFKGRVDSDDFSKLAVEKLEVRATAFSLGAADSPAANPKDGRIGQAAFLVDLGRLVNNVRQPSRNSVAQPSSSQGTAKTALVSLPSQSRLSLSGRMQGNLAWQINHQEAAFNLKTNTEQLEVASQQSGGAGTVAAKEQLWTEPNLAAVLEGAWQSADSALRLHKLEVQAPWLHLAGNLDYSSTANMQSALFKGQCVYDAGQVGQKLRPWVGDHVQLAGQKTVPIEVKWSSGADQKSTSALAGLQASTRIGWEQARVVGIQVGTADVPVSITNGLLSTAAEIPVSGGVLRWDVAGDLTSDEMMLTQKPMTVLDNVAITPEMCESWLKYVAPLVAQATSVEGRLSMKLNEARLNPMNPRSQLVDGQLIMHNAQVGPGPLSNQIIGLVQQVNAIRKQDFSQLASNPKTWLNMPTQDIRFRMENGQVAHQHLNMHIGDVNLTTSGAVDIDGRMNLLAEMPIPDDWVEKSPLLVSMRGKSLQFPVRGSLTGPQLDTQLLTQFGRDTVQQAAQGLIQRELQRGLGKLFGAPPAPQGTPNQ